MARGVRRTPIFLDDEDRGFFLRNLDYAGKKTGIQLSAYCLMENHVHVLAEAGGQTLGRFMQLATSRHAREFNKKTEASGHLFQGRFAAYPAKNVAWALQRAHYIHLNPVAAGRMNDPLRYPWSSIAAYLGGQTPISILQPNGILRYFGSTIQEQVDNYVRDISQLAAATVRTRETEREILSNYAERGAEEIRIQLFEARRVLRFVESLRDDPREIASLTSYFCWEWGCAASAVVARILGISERQVRRLCRVAEFREDLVVLGNAIQQRLSV